MSLSKARLLLLVACTALLASCDFTPIHDDGQLDGITNQTTVQVTGRREGFILEHLLRQRFGVVYDQAEYDLSVNLNVSTRQGPLQGEDTHRYLLVGNADLLLVDNKTGGVLLEDSIDATSSWNEKDRSFANRAAFDDANERLLTLLAERIHTRILASGLSRQS